MATAGQIIRAADFPASAQDTDTTDQTNLSDTSYAAGSTTCGVAFTAPTSGRVLILWHAEMRADTADVRLLISVQVREGSVVGSGTITSAANDEDAAQTSQDVASASRAYLGASSHRVVTGLTAGSSYNVRTMHKLSSAGTGDIFYRSVDVIPIP